jgi:hypothetical protein
VDFDTRIFPAQAAEPARQAGSDERAYCKIWASANLDGVAKQGSDPAGDRQANNALHTIARIRARHDEPTRTYLERRISEGKTPSEAMRALKRHLSRSLYRKLITIPLT